MRHSWNSFTTIVRRRTARRKLVAANAEAALIECLDSTSESVVWSAIRSLGELRAEQAIQPLIGLLERDVLVLDVCEALAAITGRDLGTYPDEWKAHARRKRPAPVESSSTSACLKEVSRLLGVEPGGSGENVSVFAELT